MAAKLQQDAARPTFRSGVAAEETQRGVLKTTREPPRDADGSSPIPKTRTLSCVASRPKVHARRKDATQNKTKTFNKPYPRFDDSRASLDPNCASRFLRSATTSEL